jgi:hypothetical protein
MTGFFYINPVPSGQRGEALPEPNLETPPLINLVYRIDKVEIELWRAIKDSNKVEDFKTYLSRYPAGMFVEIARSRIVSLQSEPPEKSPYDSSAEVEATLDLTPAKRRELQERLSLLGFYRGKATGFFDDATRSAIKRWQKSRGYPASGYFSERTSRLPAGPVSRLAPACRRPSPWTGKR